MKERLKHDNPQRRRPTQSRSRATSCALQETFVRLLQEQEFEQIRIRELVEVAGVGLGTFYEYFASKEELAQVCLHFRTKEILLAIQQCVVQYANQSAFDIADAIIQAKIELHRQHPQKWGKLYLLERHLTDRLAYEKMFSRFVEVWKKGLETSSDWPTQIDAAHPAMILQASTYGIFAHRFIKANEPIDIDELTRHLTQMTHGYLRAYIR